MIKHPDASETSMFKNLSLDASLRSEKSSVKIEESKGVEGSEKLVVEENSEELLRQGGTDRETALENPRRCLFCNKLCGGIKKCLDHMRIQHSFVILDVDCLVDLKGLQEYLAERIHIGNMCLFCSKTFRDGRRAQQHMLDKGHCMMNMEDEDEYVDFYDFSKTYKDHPLLIKQEGEEEDAESEG